MGLVQTWHLLQEEIPIESTNAAAMVIKTFLRILFVLLVIKRKNQDIDKTEREYYIKEIGISTDIKQLQNTINNDINISEG